MSVELVDVVVLDDQQEQPRDDLRDRLQREQLAHDACFAPSGTPALGQRPAQIGVAVDERRKPLQLGERRADGSPDFDDDVEQGARITARRSAASHGCPSRCDT